MNRIDTDLNSGELSALLPHLANPQDRFVLATVLSRSGSGPREAGASMLVDAAGKTFGTVGGGLLEAQVIDLAGESIRRARSFCRQFVLTSKQAAESGMMCGGRMEVLVEYISASDPVWREIAGRVARLHRECQGCLLIRSIRVGKAGHAVEGLARRPETVPVQDAMPVHTGLALLAGDDFISGSLEMSGFNRDLFRQASCGHEAVLITRGDIRYFIQPVGIPETVVIAGAGHVSRALAPLCRYAGFGVWILDDRPDFATPEHFPEADGVLLVPSFEHCFRDLEPHSNHYVVIVTRGHEHDRTVLAEALRTNAGYVGMIGSRRKRDLIYESLHRQGFTAADTARVHCPIGLAIGAQTPVEIAVSIVAELIAVRSQRRSPNAG